MAQACPIAVVALGAAFPGAESGPEALWALAREGRSAIAEAPAARWPAGLALREAGAGFVPDAVPHRRMGLLAPDFQPHLAGLAWPEAALEAEDPSVRLAVHVVRQAWEGLPAGVVDPAKVGLVLGHLVLPTEAMGQALLATRGAQAAREAGLPSPVAEAPAHARLGASWPASVAAAALGLGGGAYALDAACASALVAVARACEALQAGRWDVAIAGGVARPAACFTQAGFEALHALSPTGQCAPFGTEANGLVVGEGGGVVALMRLADARAKGLPVLALVSGVGLSNDRDGGMLAPQVEGQLRAIRQAHEAAAWGPEGVGFVACHATGTPAGDTAERASLSEAYAGLPGPVALGALKANLGHALTAAGAAGLIEAVMALRAEELPPFAPTDRALPAEVDGPFRALRSAQSWPRPEGHPRRAAVSAFGFGGINAHVLLEAEEGQAAPAWQKPPAPGPLALVALGARVGGAEAGLAGFAQAALGALGPAEARALPAEVRGGGLPGAPGLWLDEVEADAKALRVPPAELAAALPMQLALAEAVGEAWATVAPLGLAPERVGAFTGLSMDPGMAAFLLRWEAPEGADREALSPALTGERVVGALGGMAASRAARLVRAAGVGYALMAEEASGLAALSAAADALQAERLDAALVAAVDFPGDPRWGELAKGPWGEGAVALVLMRPETAEAHGLAPIAWLEGQGLVAKPAGALPDLAVQKALRQALGTQGPEGVGLALGSPAQGSGLTLALGVPGAGPRTALAQSQAGLGALGAASGLADLALAAIALREGLLPPAGAGWEGLGDGLHQSPSAKPWWHDAEKGPRRATLACLSAGGQAWACRLSEAPATAAPPMPGATWSASPEELAKRIAHRPLGPWPLAMVGVAATWPREVAAALERLAAFMDERPEGEGAEAAARAWWARGIPEGRLGASVVARSPAEFSRRAREMAKAIDEAPGKAIEAQAWANYAPKPIGPNAPLAFVFPGSGNHRPGMGQALGAAFPGLVARQHAATWTLATQWQAPKLSPWRAAWPPQWEAESQAQLDQDHQACLMGQVAFGALAADLLVGLGLEPEALIGYSLGETAALVASGLWADRDELARRMANTPLFKVELAGRLEAVRRTWGLRSDEVAAWTVAVLDQPATLVRKALRAYPRAYLLIVNAPGECVVGGQPDQVEALAQELGARQLKVPGVTAVHCPVALEVEDAYRQLHRLEVAPKEGLKVYSAAWAEPYEPNAERAAGSITAQALEGFDFTKLIRKAHGDELRVFIEVGPGRSCTRLIDAILGAKPHLSRAAFPNPNEGPEAIVRLMAQLWAERRWSAVDRLYPPQAPSQRPSPAAPVRVPVAVSPPGPGAWAAPSRDAEVAAPEAVSVLKPVAPMAELAAPVAELAAPVAEQAAPEAESLAGVAEEAAPALAQAALVAEAPAPLADLALPATEAVAAALEEAAPPTGAVAPVVEAAVPPTDAVAPLAEVVAPLAEVAAPLAEAVAPEAPVARPVPELILPVVVVAELAVEAPAPAAEHAGPLAEPVDLASGFGSPEAEGAHPVAAALAPLDAEDAQPVAAAPPLLQEAAPLAVALGEPEALAPEAIAPEGPVEALPAELLARAAALGQHAPVAWATAAAATLQARAQAMVAYQRYAELSARTHLSAIALAQQLAARLPAGVGASLPPSGADAPVAPAPKVQGGEAPLAPSVAELAPPSLAPTWPKHLPAAPGQALWPDGRRQDLEPPPEARALPAWLDYEACLAYARGPLAPVLGPDYAAIDAFPSRVRLPDLPLMLCHRVLEVGGGAHSMGAGSLVTEHGVWPEAWYLDEGQMPVGVCVESGQADLLLSGYLGIDARTQGQANYRLLDAEVCFHGPLPQPGETMRYAIHIDGFERQDDAWLFRFRFEGTVGDRPVLSMRHGVAGFFTPARLAAGRGVVFTALDLKAFPQRAPEGWGDLVPEEGVAPSLDAEALAAYRRGDLATAFGAIYGRLPLAKPTHLPDGLLRLIHRITLLEPKGGRFDLGKVRAELDNHPEAWYLPGHFVDDPVMPGTMMYEGCLQALRVLLARMGWVGEADAVRHQPVPGIKSRLQCRGQVLGHTQLVAYEVEVRQVGFEPFPHVVADAIMYADGKAIVRISNMSLGLQGLDVGQLKAMWRAARGGPAAPAPEQAPFASGHWVPTVPEAEGAIPTAVAAHPAPYDRARILAYAVGKPSEAFGAPYLPFDGDRRIARLPGPPFMFVDRVEQAWGTPFVCEAGAGAVAAWELPHEHWSFLAGGQGGHAVPFAVLLEAALQPCGWLAAYAGSALISPTDLKFRNLGGDAVVHRALGPRAGTVRVKAELTKVAKAGGMLVQDFAFHLSDAHGPVYEGTTTFGFFTEAALSQQVGLRGAKLPLLGAEASAHELPLYPPEGLGPKPGWRFLGHTAAYWPGAGAEGLGALRAEVAVDPQAWYFAAHFYQDPVMPGSLGLEAIIQGLTAMARARWPEAGDRPASALATGERHRWQYRGQVLPGAGRIAIELEVTRVDEGSRTLWGRGVLGVDGRWIYGVEDFAVRLGGGA